MSPATIPLRCNGGLAITSSGAIRLSKLERNQVQLTVVVGVPAFLTRVFCSWNTSADAGLI
jgi:hypothetical protein